MADSTGKKMLKNRQKELEKIILDYEQAKQIQLDEAIAYQTKIDALNVELVEIKSDISKL